MAGINRVRAVWTGLPGGAAVSTFYSDGGGVPNIAALKSAFDSIQNFVPQGVSVLVENQGDQINDADGSLIGNWSTTAVSASAMLGTGSYSSASGAQIGWTTGGIHNGRRLRGRTFVVPLVVACYTTTGTLGTSTTTALQGFADQVKNATGMKYLVWGRPRAAGGRLPAAPGLSSPITGSKISNKVAVLRSRRD